ncbi:MAG TPA: hypothetical protein QF555_04965 [Candidatus Thalassarchaeaceae archaeon]|jgi:hypothetical protein|nr:hypothetical protein [Candidatus Thalassarchaeaceae archaeon]
MTDIQWDLIDIEGDGENEVIQHSLDTTAAELHSHFIAKVASDSPAIGQHEQFLQAAGEQVERTREADSQILAQHLLGASLDASAMIDGVAIMTLGIPSNSIEVRVGTHSGTTYLRIDREGLEPVVSPLPYGRKILEATHSKGRLEIRFSE